MPLDDFYVGYLPRAPRALARLLAQIVAAAIALGLIAGLVLVFSQQPFPRATFEFGEYRDFAGFLEARPYPALLVPRPGASDKQPVYSRYLLVAAGKHGADAEVQHFVNRSVRLRGSLIYRDSETMIELLPGSLGLQTLAQGGQRSDVSMGQVTVTGEIVDSKCYLGVMNPGRAKVHRDCAARCISGGIPPMLVTADSTYLLTGKDGGKLNQEVLDVVGETIQVQGEVIRDGENLTLRADPGTYRRLSSISAGLK
jgi:hypothetical protein